MPKMPPDYLIQKRRAADDARQVYVDVAADNFKVGARAEWEIRSGNGIEARRTQARFNAVRAADAASLDARRRKLAALLAAEQAEQQEQLISLDMTPAQRKVEMEQRCAKLKAAREGERQAYVKEQYERQWRLACDPLREQESIAIMKATNAARAYQIGEKMNMLEMEERENRVFDDMWEQDRRTKLGREEKEAAHRAQMESDQKSVLDQQVTRKQRPPPAPPARLLSPLAPKLTSSLLPLQVTELHHFRASEKTLAQQESELLKEQWDLERAEARRVEEIRQDMILRAQDELDEFNKHKRAQLARAVAAEKSEDAARLKAVLDHEAKMDASEHESKQKMQEETRAFGAAMIAQKRALASYEGEMERLREEQQAKEWEKRLTVWRQEQDARERLMAQVLDERAIQVEEKLKLTKLKKVKEAEARVELEAELERINALEDAKVAEGKHVLLQHRDLLKNQIDQKRFEHAASQFNKKQEKMMAERAEAQYQAMLDDQMFKVKSQMEKFSKKY